MILYTNIFLAINAFEIYLNLEKYNLMCKQIELVNYIQSLIKTKLFLKLISYQ